MQLSEKTCVMDEEEAAYESDTDTVVSKDEKSLCGTCKVECEMGQEALGCELCSKWYHRECLKYNKGTYNAIIKFDEVKWFCKECNAKTKDTLSMIQLVMQRMDVLDGRNGALEKKNAALEKRLLKMEQIIDQGGAVMPRDARGIEENTWAERVNKNDSGPITFSQIIAEEMREQKEIEERKCNLMITNIPEDDVPLKEDEKEKLSLLSIGNGENSKNVVEKLIVKLGVKDAVVGEVIRIPQRREGQEGDKPRKLLVKLANAKMKRDVLEQAKNMQKVGDVWKTTYISPDLTKKQRDKAYQLRVEKRRRTEAGETNLVIKNGAVVVRDVSNQPFHLRGGQSVAT